MNDPFGRIEVHAHLLPGVDDGCANIEQSISCARTLVSRGYTHAFCTPHNWPDRPHFNDPPQVRRRTEELRAALAEADVPLQIAPGGEINLSDQTRLTPPERLLTYGLEHRYILFDFWADVMPDFFEPTMRWFQSLGLQPIMAHPERLKAFHAQPELADRVREMGIWLQGNLQCLADPPETPYRRLAEQYLTEGKYFMLGGDIHRPDTIEYRMGGLTRAAELVSPEKLDELLMHNPRKLWPT